MRLPGVTLTQQAYLVAVLGGTLRGEQASRRRRLSVKAPARHPRDGTFVSARASQGLLLCNAPATSGGALLSLHLGALVARRGQELVVKPGRDLLSTREAGQRRHTNPRDLLGLHAENTHLLGLPRVRADIRANKRLHFVLFCALRKACYKPAAFFKGLLLPLCAAGNCTLREAVVFGAIISRNSLPLLHAAAALQKLAEMEYSGTNSYFIRVLLKKKYALPYRVLVRDTCCCDRWSTRVPR